MDLTEHTAANVTHVLPQDMPCVLNIWSVSILYESNLYHSQYYNDDINNRFNSITNTWNMSVYLTFKIFWDDLGDCCTWMDNLLSLVVVEQQHSIHSLCCPEDCSHLKMIAKPVDTKKSVSFHKFRWTLLSLFLLWSASSQLATKTSAFSRTVESRTSPPRWSENLPGAHYVPTLLLRNKMKQASRQQLVWLLWNPGIQNNPNIYIYMYIIYI